MKARVVFSQVGWPDEDGRRRNALSGEVVDLPQAEFDRLAALGAVTRFAGGGVAVSEPPVDAPPHPHESRAVAKRSQRSARSRPPRKT